jgi:hypothetical protein
VTFEGRQINYGTYLTEDLAGDAQAGWRLTHLLPADDPEQIVDLPASVAVGGVRCDEWFARLQVAKKADDREYGSITSSAERSPPRREARMSEGSRWHLHEPGVTTSLLRTRQNCWSRPASTWLKFSILGEGSTGMITLAVSMGRGALEHYFSSGKLMLRGVASGSACPPAARG